MSHISEIRVYTVQDLFKTVKADVILDYTVHAFMSFIIVWSTKHVLPVNMAPVADTALNHPSLTHSLDLYTNKNKNLSWTNMFVQKIVHII